MMNRKCTHKKTGELIEFQSGHARLGTLTDNAIAAGYAPDDIIEQYTEDDITTVMSKHATPADKERMAAHETARQRMDAARGIDKANLTFEQRVKRIEDILGV